MGRRRGLKLAFPIPGRKTHKTHVKIEKDDNDVDDDAASSNPSILSARSIPDRSPHYREASNYSKAERLLGTAGPHFYPPTRQTAAPPSPGYMTISVSEASFGSDLDDKASLAVADDGNYLPAKRPTMSNRPSSNILGYTYREHDRRGSNGSSVSRRIHPKSSNSTMHSHYDSQTSPPAISQQTSDSAVRDMALRKGKPRVASPYLHDSLVPSPLGRDGDSGDQCRQENRRSRPPRLDLSKLFPRPRGHGDQEQSGALLSPNKLVNSPTAMSIASDYFPRPMTREPTPTPNGNAKLTKMTKTSKRQQAPASRPQKPTSPVRMHRRDTYDSAKIHVRRPPRGVQHWFDAFDEDSDESTEEDKPPVHAPKPVKANHIQTPIRKSSLGRLMHDAPYAQHQHSQLSLPFSRKEQYGLSNASATHHSNSPRQISSQSQTSLVSTRTKESTFSKSNLQDSSVLSISSSEDETEEEVPAKKKFAVRNSLDVNEDHGDIVIGQAQAFEMRPQPARRPSAGLSIMSTSTNAATIEVMYTPEPYNTQHFPRSQNSSRRSSHMRQPSVIHEDDDVRLKTSGNRPLSPSTNSLQSARTSTSEPRRTANGHKFMAVTAEEEALLEMMRKKRAAMAKQSFSEGFNAAALQEETRQTTPTDQCHQAPRTSAFLSAETPSVSPIRLVETKSTKKPSAGSAPPLLAPPRGRSGKPSNNTATSTNMPHDSSSSDVSTERRTSPSSQATLAHCLSPPPEFSPLDPFPLQTPTASIASPTTTDHHSPLPSPITPGPRHSGADVSVKVASSEPSCNGDSDEVAVLDSGVIDPPSGSIKPEESHPSENASHHQRRRTASSGADISFPPPPTTGLHDLAPVSEASSRTPSINEPTNPPLPRLPMKSPKRTSAFTVSTNGNAPSRSRQSSTVSSGTSSPVTAASLDRRTSRNTSRGNSIASIKRDSVAIGTASTRCSVSEDVLAAWGSLGGMRDYDTERY